MTRGEHYPKCTCLTFAPRCLAGSLTQGEWLGR